MTLGPIHELISFYHIFYVRIYISYHWCILNHYMINLEITTHAAEEFFGFNHEYIYRKWEYMSTWQKYRHYLGREIKVNIHAKQAIIIVRYQDILKYICKTEIRTMKNAFSVISNLLTKYRYRFKSSQVKSKSFYYHNYMNTIQTFERLKPCWVHLSSISTHTW